jgi:hypothetical protein
MALPENISTLKPEQNFSVSTDTNMFLVVINDQQAQQSRSGFSANAQNTLITGGSFTVSLHCSVSDFGTKSMDRTLSIFSLLTLVECR